MINTIRCPVCNKELNLKDSKKFPLHMISDQDHINHLIETEIKIILRHSIPSKKIPN
jgi:hypothetical protein